MTKAKTKDEFVQRWKKWHDCFDDKNPNSINAQITAMLWNYGIWNLINKSRGTLPKYPNGSIIANANLHNSVNSWFFETQMIAVRRMLDKNGLDGDWGYIR